jgi:hypothetical protein
MLAEFDLELVSEAADCKHVLHKLRLGMVVDGQDFAA